MRVVQVVCSDGFGGVERYICTLALALAQRHDMEVVVIGGAEDRMRDAFDGSRVTWRRADTPRQALAAMRRLPTPDVVNTHMSEADIVGFLFRVLGRRRVALVSTLHFGARRGRDRLRRGLLRLVAARVDAQLAISDFVAARAEGDPVVVHSGVADRDDDRERGRTVLVAQRLEPEKDTETAVRAWAAVHAGRPDWRLQVAGAGGQEPALRLLAEELGVAGSVDFLGFRTDVHDLLAHAGIVVAPTPREGLGILVLEAMASGAPVVAAAGGGHLETVGAVAPELMFPPGDAAAAAAIIDRLIADAAERRAVGERLRALQRASFTTRSQVEGTVALYERVAPA